MLIILRLESVGCFNFSALWLVVQLQTQNSVLTSVSLVLGTNQNAGITRHLKMDTIMLLSYRFKIKLISSGKRATSPNIYCMFSFQICTNGDMDTHSYEVESLI